MEILLPEISLLEKIIRPVIVYLFLLIAFFAFRKREFLFAVVVLFFCVGSSTVMIVHDVGFNFTQTCLLTFA